MKQLLHLKSLLIALFVLFGGGSVSAQETKTLKYEVKTASSVNLISGQLPEGVNVSFKNTYTNNKAQMTKGNSMTLTLTGFPFSVSSVTLNLKTNTSSGQGNLKVTHNGVQIHNTTKLTTNPVAYSTTYKEYTFTTVDTQSSGDLVITLAATENSLYCDAFTITYVDDSAQGQGTLDPQNSFANATENATVGKPYTVQEITTLSTGRKSYKSSDVSVATIDGSGKVTLKKAGETTITVTTAADDTYKEGSASYTLIVSKGTPELSFDSETVTAYLGTNQDGPELNNPGDGTKTYTISDPDVATIRQTTGYIEPLKAGQATVTVTTSETDAWLSATASYTLVVKEAFHIDAEGDYEWVKDVSTLAAGDELVFVYQSSNDVAAVMGDQQTNNFKYVGVNYAESITDKSVITIPQEKAEKATSIALEGSKGAWYFNTNNGYLYAASSSSNHLKTANLETAGNNAKATISISENGNATIVFQGTNTNKNLRYNTGSSLFSCYSTGQKPIQIYRKVDSHTLPMVPISFAESIVEITYGDNYDKQKATAKDYSGDLKYTSSDESIVKFHGNNVIDVLGPGTVTITATAPATETTSESSATYTLKIHEPADAVEGQTELLNEKFDDCKGDEPKDGFDGNSSGFTTAPTSLTEAGWELSHCQAGAGFLKLTSGDGNGIVVTPTLDLNGQSEFSFEIAPWVNETATVTVSLENATFEDGIETSKSFNDLEQNTWKTKSFGIVGNGNVRIKIEATSRVFIDNFIVGGSAQPAHEINLKFSSAGYLTWMATADIDFEATERVTAYQITEATPQGITAEEVKKAPKGAALLLKGSGTVQLKRTSGVAPLQNNKMQACTDASVTGITGSATSTDIYVLGNGGNGLGFYMLKNTLQAGKGYLKISGDAGAKATFIGFEETEAAETTGISDYTVPSTEDDNFYNLQGVRVVRPQKGIYIKNGKKMIIK